MFAHLGLSSLAASGTLSPRAEAWGCLLDAEQTWPSGPHYQSQPPDLWARLSGTHSPQVLVLRWPSCAAIWVRSYKDQQMKHPVEPRSYWQSIESRNKFWGDLLCSSNWCQVITRQCSRYPFIPVTLPNAGYSPLTATTGAMQKPKCQLSQGFLISWQLFQVTICFGYNFSFTEPMSLCMPPNSGHYPLSPFLTLDCLHPTRL